MDKIPFDSTMISRETTFTYLESLKDYFSPLRVVETGTTPSVRFDPGIKAVLFDIYGTLLISEAGDIGLTDLDRTSDQMFQVEWDGSFRNFSFNRIRSLLTDSVARHHARIRENNRNIQYPEVDIITLWHEILQTLGIEQYGMEELCRNSLRFEILSNKVALMPNVPILFDFLRRRYLPLGIVSNAQFYTPLLLEYLSGKTLNELGFKKELTAWSFELQCGKPDEQIFHKPLAVLNGMGIRSDEVLYVGNDMLNDIATASAMGMKTVLFAGDKRSLRLRNGDSRVDGVFPDYIITDLIQLQQILEDGTDE